MSDCWYIPDTVTDQWAENRLSPNEPCSYEKLAQLGVYYKHFDTSSWQAGLDAFAESLKAELHYKHHDVIDIRRGTLGEKFDALAHEHFAEHLHEDDEVRLILGGSGYFDVRDDKDRWVRVLVLPGDCIIVPAGLYHRFTTRPDRETKAMRIFKENPRWIAIPRAVGDALAARRAYLTRLHEPAETVVGRAEGAANGVFSIAFPAELDASLTWIWQQHLRQHNDPAKTAALLYVVGANAYGTQLSWCPNCVQATPLVVQGYKALRARYGEGLLYVECPVLRAAYKGNEHYPYRVHPLLKVTGIPTVLVLKPKANAAATLASHPHASWTELVDVKARTEEPTAELLSGV